MRSATRRVAAKEAPGELEDLAMASEASSEATVAAVLLEQPEAFLSRSDLRELGLGRRAVDAIFRGCPVVSLPGYSRPLIRVADFRAFVAEHTYAGDRVRPCGELARLR